MGKKRKGKRASQKRKNQPYYKVQSVSKCDHSVEEKPAVKLKAERDHDRPSHDVRYDDGAGAILGISVSFCEDMSPGAICSSIQGALESKLKKMYLPEDEILEILTPNSCDRTTFDVHMKTVRGAWDRVYYLDNHMFCISSCTRPCTFCLKSSSSFCKVIVATRLSELGTVIYNNIRMQLLEVVPLSKRTDEENPTDKENPTRNASAQETAEEKSLPAVPDALSSLEMDDYSSSNSESRSSTPAQDQQNILKLPSLPNEEDEIMKTATDGENSGNMLNSESSVDLSKETQSVSDNCRKLMISGILPSTTNDELELYFESHKKSGGGDIELVERVNEESAIITFEDSSVALSVLSKKQHLKGNELKVLPYAPKDEGTNRKIVVKGINNIIETEMLEMYFENKRKSGGGEIEKFEWIDESVIITFENLEVAKRVLEKEGHRIGNTPLEVAPYTEKAAEYQGNKFSGETTVDNDVGPDMAKTVEIHGEIGNISAESLELYLESTKRSGGGPIEKMDLKASPALVTFKEAADAESVCAKRAHTYSGVNFQIKRAKAIKAIQTDPRYILLCNLNPCSTEDAIKNYVENVCGEDVEDIIFQQDRTVARIKLKAPPDLKKMRETIEKKPRFSKLDGFKVQFKPMPVCKSVLITNFAEKTTKDGIMLKLEHPSIGGEDSVENIDLQEDNKYAVVHLENPDVASKLLQATITLDGSRWKIFPYFDSFLSDEVDKIIKASKKKVNIKVDLDIMEYINASSKHKEILTGVISQSATLPTADQDGNHFISVEEASGEHFTEFYNKFDKMSIKVNSDEFQTSQEDIEREIKQLQSSVQGCALKMANGRIVIVGQQPSVKEVNAKMSQKLQELKEEFTKKQEQKEFFPLPPEKIRLLDHSSCWDEIRKQHMVQVEVQSGGLMITGQENKIEKAKMFLLMKVMNVCSRTMKISRGNYNLLGTKGGVDKVYAYLKSCSVNAVITVIPDRCEVSITSLSTREADEAVSALQNAMQDKPIPLDEGTRKLVQSDKGSSFIRELEKCYCVEIQKIDGTLSNLSIVGIDINEAHEELIKFLNDNAVHKKFITISMGLIRFIFQHCKDHLKDIKGALQKELVTIEQSDGAILITGTQLGLWTAVEQIKEVYSQVKKDKIISQRPGVRKLFQKGFIKDVIRGVENELSLVIINELEDVEASIEEVTPIKHKLENDDGQNRLISSFKTQEGKRICVYQGDITKHKVDVIVNAANNQLSLGGGVAGAILREGGKVIQNECDEHIRKHGDLADGDVAITGAGKINCQRIVHAVGPRWQNAVSYIGERELRSKQETAKDALNLAVENTLNAVQQYQSVAIPAISSGVFGFPKDLCANILVSAALKFCKTVPWSKLREIHFINNDVPTVKAFEQEFERRFKSQAGYKIEAPLLADTSSTRTNWWNDEVKKPQTFTTGKPLGTKKKDVGVAPASRNTDDSTTLRTPEGIAIDLVIGDLSKQKVDVIVNSAASNLRLSANPCARALSNAAGSSLQAQCDKAVAKGPLSEWNFAITSAGKLGCKSVYHAVCGGYDGTGQAEKNLATMLENLLRKASELKMKSIALPALGTGTLGFPRDVVAQIMIDSVFKFSKATSNTSLKEIRFVAFHMDTPTLSSFKKEFKNSGNSGSGSKSQGTGVCGAVAQTNVRRAPKRTSSTRSSASDSQLEDTTDFSIVLGPLTVELVHGDITEENTDAIVVVGNERLDFGGAVGRAIIRKEGASFQEKAKKNCPQKQMTKLLSTAKMPSKHVLHLVPPSADYPSYKDMLKATSQLFVDAEQHKLESISVPAIGSGLLSYPPQKSASIILLAIADRYMMEERSSLRKVRIVIFEEPMLETFREEIMKILESPETYLENLDDYKGIMDWMKGRGKAALDRIKKFFTNSVTFLSSPANSWAYPGKKKASMVKPRKANEFDDVTFVIYSTDQRNIQKAKNRIEKMVDDNITPVTTKKPGFAKLSAKQKADIEIKARASDVSVKFKEDGTLTIVGYHEDTSKIMDYCHEVVLEKIEEDSQIEKGNLMAEIVQWVEVADDNSRTEYEPEVNMRIEEAYKNDEKSIELQLLLDDSDKVYTCSLDLQAMIGKINGDGTSFKLERVMKGNDQGISLPKEWEAMPKDAYGKETAYHVVTLKAASPEYNDVHRKVMQSSQGQIARVATIRRIQNPQLYKSFMARKETMDKTGVNGSNERELFHGTSEASCDNINHHGFNRSMAGKNATVYGVGVYFAVDSAYSSRYADASSFGNRHMYLVRVLTGDYAQGHSSYKTPPKKAGSRSTDAYDTVVDNTANPRIFVTFFDNQCYPQYLIVFQ